MLSKAHGELLAQTWRDGATRVTQAHAAGGSEKAADVAHALAGVAATLSVSRVRDAARHLEAQLRAESQPAIDEDLRELDAALEAFTNAVERAQRADPSMARDQ